MNPNVIEMNGITVGALRDANVAVVKAVDWSVAAGEFWVVAGAQGSGKSDFLMLAGGLTTPLAGEYRLLGHAMPVFDDAELSERLKVGFVFDGGQLFNQLTIAENIALPLRYHQNLTRLAADKATWTLLELLDLTAFANNTPANVPRAWLKRAGLARALMLKPEILLLDNPLGGLDARHASWWLNFLEELRQGHPWLEKQPATLVVTADDLRAWRGGGREFALLAGGKFLTLGGWDAIECADVAAVRELLAVPAIDPRGGI